MISASELKQSSSKYQDFVDLVAERVKEAAQQGKQRVNLDVYGNTDLAESLVPELRQKGYLAYVDYGNTSEGGYKILRICWKRDTSNPPSWWENFQFYMNQI